MDTIKRFQEYCNQIIDWSIKEVKGEIDYYESIIPNFERVLNIVVQLNFKVLSFARSNQETKFKMTKVDKNVFYSTMLFTMFKINWRKLSIFI